MKLEDYKVKPCELGVSAFEEEQPYTMFCEACQLWAKIPKYRSCPKRHAYLLSQGVDVFAPINVHSRVASAQQGVGNRVGTTVEAIDNPKKQSRRGR